MKAERTPDDQVANVSLTSRSRARFSKSSSGEDSVLEPTVMSDLGDSRRTVLMLGVYFLVGVLLVLGQLVPGGTLQVASGESLPQALLWLLVGALIATDHLLTRYVDIQGRVLASHQLGSTLRPQRWPWFLGTGLLICVLVSTWNVQGQANFRFAVNGCWQWFVVAVSIVVLYHLMKSQPANRSLRRLMVSLAWLVSIHGFYQVYVSLPADREKFRVNPQAVLEEAGLVAPPGSSTYLLFEQRLQDNSPTGPFALTNSLAGFLLPWIVILFAQGIKSETWTRQNRFHQWMGLFVIACLLVCLVWTKSRTAWIALCFGGLAALIVNPETLRHLKQFIRRGRTGAGLPFILAIGIAIALSVAGLQAWDPKLFSEASRSLAFRSEYWKTTMRMVLDHPWLGVGPGNFQAYYATYKPVLESETIGDPHNFLLETLAVCGWPGLFFLLGSIVWLAKPITNRFADALLGEPLASNPFPESHGGRWEFNSTSIAIYLGALVGLFAIWFGNGALGPIPDFVPYLIAIPVVMATLWTDILVAPTTAQSVDNSSNVVGFGPALLALGVHLLASGGWMTPGIGNTLSILVAGLWLAQDTPLRRVMDGINQPKQHASNTDSPLHGAGTAILWTLVAWTLVIGFYLTAWLPKQRFEQAESSIRQKGGIEEVHAIALQRADLWNPIGYRWLAEIRLRQVDRELTKNRNGLAPSMELFQESARSYLAADRASWETWAQLGHWEFMISPLRKESLNRALEYFIEASRRAPGDVGLLTQVALAAWLAEDVQTAKTYLAQAELIDTNVTHLDRKLAKSTLYWPANVGPPSTRIAPTVWQSARESKDLSQGWVRSEPVFRFLRTQLATIR